MKWIFAVINVIDCSIARDSGLMETLLGWRVRQRSGRIEIRCGRGYRS